MRGSVQGIVQDLKGNALIGASISVYTNNGLFDTKVAYYTALTGGTVKSQDVDPIVTDAVGQWQAFIDAGNVDIKYESASLEQRLYSVPVYDVDAFEAATGHFEDAYDAANLALSSSITAVDARDEAIAAKEAAINAAEVVTNDVMFFDTKAEAIVALPGLPEDRIIEVYADESQDGYRTRYQVESSAYVLKIVYGQGYYTTAEGEAFEELVEDLVDQISDIDFISGEADRAEAAANAAALSGEIYASTADALSNGVYSLDSLVVGSGGTDGTFALAFSGGAGSGAAGWFTVVSGAISAYEITTRGQGYTSAPTVSFAASAGLSGASATAVIAANRAEGQYFSIPTADDGKYLQSYLVEAGPAATAGKVYPSATAITSKLGDANPERSGWASVALDSLNRILYGSNSDGKFYAEGVEVVTLLNLVLPLSSYIDSLGYASPERSGWAHATVDNLNQILYGVRGDGKFIAEGVEVVTLLNQVLPISEYTEYSLVISGDPDRTGVLFSVNDEADQMLMHLTTDLVLYAGTLPVVVSEEITASVAALDARFATDNDFAAFGDSLTAGTGSSTASWRYPTRLGISYSSVYVASNEGIGGQDSTEISARANGYATLVTLTGNEIPASGAVDVESIFPTLLTSPATNVARTQLGWINGVYGTLSKDTSDEYSFERAEAGDAVAVYPETIFVVDLGDLATRIRLFWMGTNDDYSDDAGKQQVIDNIDAAIAAIPSLEKRYLVLPPLTNPVNISGSAEHTANLELSHMLKMKYKDRFVPVRDALVASYDAGDAQDVIDHGNDVVPTSLRSSGVHLNDDGYQIVADTVRLRLDQLNWPVEL